MGHYYCNLVLLGKNLDENIAIANRTWPGIKDGKPQTLFKAWRAKQ